MGSLMWEIKKKKNPSSVGHVCTSLPVCLLEQSGRLRPVSETGSEASVSCACPQVPWFSLSVLLSCQPLAVSQRRRLLPSPRPFLQALLCLSTPQPLSHSWSELWRFHRSILWSIFVFYLVLLWPSVSYDLPRLHKPQLHPKLFWVCSYMLVGRFFVAVN